MNTCYTFRRITFETASALHAGSGEGDPLQDMPVQLDCFGNPTINATSIIGVLRHLYGSVSSALFGDDGNHTPSRLVVSDASILDENGDIALDKQSDYLKDIKRLSWRDHCRISHKGTADKTGKFDRTVLIAGIRFLVELCITAETIQKAEEEMNKLTNLFQSDDFRLGGGTRNGFGKIQVLKITGDSYDLNDKEMRSRFLGRSAALAEDAKEPVITLQQPTQNQTRHFQLTPEDFWLFADGSGYGDLDIRPKLERKVTWNNNKPTIEEYPILPASSIKGALAHRTAYYYNKQKGIFADKIPLEEFSKPNRAVEVLFGCASDSNDGKQTGKIGHVLISDIVCKDSTPQLFNHVTIDRFTGGAVEGHLFKEQVCHGGTLEFDLTVLPFEADDKEDILKALEHAINDLLTGCLPLGGGVMRGLGAMLGKEITSQKEE